MQDINSVPLIVRREIEALIAAPLIKAFMARFGRDAVVEVTGEVIRTLALQAGEQMKMMIGGDNLMDFQKALPFFSQGGALDAELIEATKDTIAVNITRCKYAEMYQEKGLREFGFLLACGRDYALMEGFNPKIKFNRTQTIMEGAPFCDFRFSMEEDIS